MHAHDLPANMPAILRLQRHDEFKVGARVRVLDCALARDSEGIAAPAVVTLGALSETFRNDHDHA